VCLAAWKYLIARSFPATSSTSAAAPSETYSPFVLAAHACLLQHTRSPMAFGLLTTPATCACWTSEGRMLLSHTSCHILTFGRSNFPKTLWFDYNTDLTRVVIVRYRLVTSICTHIFKAHSQICEKRLLASTCRCVLPRLPLDEFSLYLIVFFGNLPRNFKFQ
jgi:hypothetical protein